MATPPVTPEVTTDPFEGQENISFEQYSRYRETGTAPTAEPPRVEAEEGKARDEQGRFKSSDVPAESSTADAPKVEATTEPEKAETASESVPEKLEQEEERVTGKEANKRIRELLARVKELEAKQQPKADVKVESSPTTPSDVKAAPSTAKPKLQRPDIATFQGTLDEYNKALQDWDDQRSQELRDSILQEIRNAELMRDVEETEKKLPGFKKAAYDVAAQFSAHAEAAPVAQVLTNGEGWKEITHYLGEHPEEVQRLIELSKSNQIEAIAESVRLKDKVLSKKETPAPQPQPKPTAAPPPPTPVQARATISAFDVNDEKMPAEEWSRKRNEQVWKRRGR